MNNTGIYPGTFDPITLGHIDVVKRALKIVKKLVIAVSNDFSKEYLFSAEERVIIVKKAIYEDLKISKKNVQVVAFNTLTTSLCKKLNAKIIFRGLRAVSDFEYEFQMASTNKRLKPDLDTVFLTASEQQHFVASSLVKEVARLGGDIKSFVPIEIAKELKKYFKNN